MTVEFNDLREYFDEVKKLGEFKVIEGADWNLEIGAITELQCQIPDSPLLLFDNIKGSYFNILGLPMMKLKELFQQIGLDILDYVQG